MRTYKPLIPSNKKLLIFLLAVSLIGLLLPRERIGGLISLVQPLVPIQVAANVVADSITDALGSEDKLQSSEAVEALRRERAALEHQVASQSIRIAELEEEVDILTATRVWGETGRRIGLRGQLIPAGVVNADILPWRSSRLITAGTLQCVRRGAAVVSHFFSMNRGRAEGVEQGMTVLFAETLIGLVEETGTHTAHVTLLSDVSVEMKVRIVRRTEDGFVPIDRFFWLSGRGRGEMEIRDVERRDTQAGVIRIGDIVLSDDSCAMLPVSMMIGKIVAIAPDRRNPLLSILTVKSPVDEASLRRVYVFDPESATNE